MWPPESVAWWQPLILLKFFALYFLQVGSLNCVKDFRATQALQQFDIWQYAVPADDSGEVLHRGEKADLLVEGDNFLVIGTDLVGVSFDLLGPGDHQAEVGRFRELRELRSFRSRKHSRRQADRLKVRRGMLRGRGCGRSNELGVLPKVVQHADVFPTNRTIGGSPASPFCDLARRADLDGAVDHREPRLDHFDIPRGFTDKILNLKWETQM